MPDVGLLDTAKLIPAALGIFFVGFSGGILTARTYAGRHGQHVHAGTELAAMGAANLAAGISQGFPIGASGSRTSVNDQMGARTQLSGLISAGVTALVLLFLTAPVEYLPVATLGAIIVAASIGLPISTPGGVSPASAGWKSRLPPSPWWEWSPSVCFERYCWPSPFPSWMPFAAAQLRTTRYSAGLIGSIAMPTYDSTRRRLYLECWSIGSMTGCSLRMPLCQGADSRGCRRRARAPCIGWCSTLRPSTMSMPRACVR